MIASFVEKNARKGRTIFFPGSLFLPFKVSLAHSKNPPSHHSSSPLYSRKWIRLFSITENPESCIKETIFFYGWYEWQVWTRLKHF
jgi:hypothetical protein